MRIDDFEPLKQLFMAAAAGANDYVKNESNGLRTLRKFLDKESDTGFKISVDTVDKEDPQRNTLLMIACMNGNRTIADYLLNKNADQYKKNASGETALYLAAA